MTGSGWQKVPMVGTDRCSNGMKEGRVYLPRGQELDLDVSFVAACFGS